MCSSCRGEFRRCACGCGAMVFVESASPSPRCTDEATRSLTLAGYLMLAVLSMPFGLLIGWLSLEALMLLVDAWHRLID